MNNRLASICPNLDPTNNHTAIYEKERVITYGELGRRVDNLAGNILKTGVMQGSRVGLCFDNIATFVYGYMAILGANCIPVLLSPGLPAEKLAYILADSGAVGLLSDCRTFRRITSYPSGMRFVFTDDIGEPTPNHIAVYPIDKGIHLKEMAIDKHIDIERIEEAMPSNDSDIASIIYTSGTTGKPKGVMLSETNLLLATSVIMQHLELTPLDTCLVTMSFAHCAGLLHLLAHLRAGAKLVTGEIFTLIGPFLTAIKKHEVTILPGVPSFYMLLLKHSKHKIRPYLKHVRAIESSSAMITSSLIGEIADIFPAAKLLNTYGLTETPRATYMEVLPSDRETNLSVGLPTAGVSIHILNKQNQQCQPYEQGEIVVRGPNMALGYWNNPEKTAASFSATGFRTGDIGYVDNKGYLFLKGRKDDMIKIGAEAVYPHEIEEVIGSYPGIGDVLAYGVEDTIQGSAIHVKVVCKTKYIEQKAILDYCHERLEKHKLPALITFCNQIELEESGKPRRGNILP